IRNLGEFQRPLRLTYMVMNCARDFTSWSTPQKSLSCALPTAWLKPVPTGSRNTMSVLSSSVLALSASLYGGGGVGSALGVTTRRGPKAPMCSQTEAEPGPPLWMKEMGRCEESLVWVLM